ncbi:MAG: hypothetical protein MUE44_33220 [Oscillatoriaceae cyanobacterium Prado104]|jgi:hypothetical protein|nr:hypothetical protein [Oscillatoriaceae cyanobacterium Prado104]
MAGISLKTIPADLTPLINSILAIGRVVVARLEGAARLLGLNIKFSVLWL